MSYEEEKADRQKEILRYLETLSDSQLRWWESNAAALAPYERRRLVELIFDLRRLGRMHYPASDGSYTEPSTGERAYLPGREPSTQPPHTNTQEERVALWEAAKKQIYKDAVHPPKGMSAHVYEEVRTIYNDRTCWTTDGGPGGTCLTRHASNTVDELLKDPMFTPDKTNPYR